MTERYVLPSGKVITGTLVWYYAICKREVWLMGHNITPDEDFSCLEIGRAVHEIYYENMFKEVSLDGVKLDLLKRRERKVCEVKTSSRFLEAAKLQLLYYLYRLKESGIEASGEILIPKEKKKIQVSLNEEAERTLLNVLAEIREILEMTVPPKPKRTRYCRRCAYREFCWV
ncbi:CRISPR-associated protein Cas4 [Candidatus Geothermarchaeota archaeon]|nr:MAG: CRISPR-associated protein Cas4 [Candidatus Geothermarchaeota archaeon]